jgi:hypothetical protein
MPKNDQYFATLTDSTFLDELKARITAYRSSYERNGLAPRWALSLGSYFGTSVDGKTSWRVTTTGEEGELVQMKVNEYASFVKHQLVLAVKDRPAGIAKAVNNDVKTLRDSRVGSQLVEYFFSDPAHNFEEDYVGALRLAFLTAEAYIVQDWDTALGDEIPVEQDDDQAVNENGEPIDENGEPLPPPPPMNAGDLTQEVYPVWNAARDVNAPNGKVPWMIFSRLVNKWELAAKYQAYAEDIVMGSGRSGVPEPFITQPVHETSDYIEEHYFIHLPTKALPKGRIARFTADCIFLGENYLPFPYPSKNFHRVTDETLIGTSYGHTSNYDLLGLEQVTDCLHSIVLTNQSTTGVATIVGPQGTGITHQDIAKGLRFLEVPPNMVDKIIPLKLLNTPPEIFEYMKVLSGFKGQLTGINSILRGDPEGALKGASGSAMALLQSQALTYNSGAQRSYYKLLSSAGTGIIEICRTFVDDPRLVRITGKANAQAVKEFKYDAKTLGAVSTVVFEPINPILQTAAGKLTVSENLLKIPGAITSPKRYIEVLTTGNLDAFLGDDLTLQEAIMEENEYLAEGKPVSVIVTENHEDHIKGHQAILATPNSKQDPELVNAVLAHIQEHIDKWTQLSQTNPALLLATGQKVLPPTPPQGSAAPGGAPPAGGASPGNAPQPPKPTAPGAAPGAAPMNPASNEPHQPNLPNPPKNPATGEPAPMAPGMSVRQAA